MSVIVHETAENHLSLLRVSENQMKDGITQVSRRDSTTIDLKFERVIPKFGLVLAGGGAKGAYEAGVLKYMDEINLVPSIIAGTSIGAINGAVLASHQSFHEGVKRVIKLWKGIGKQNVIIRSKDNSSFFDSEPLKKLLYEEVDPDQLRNGTELWVATFSSFKDPNFDYGIILPLLIDVCSSINGKSANYYRIQDCKNNEILYKTLIANSGTGECADAVVGLQVQEKFRDQ
ncbi:patatin [Nostoc commune NIES-4072]|uniref:Patatin n=1 Tax=Nostoc commune NIES-4072 TaxID=2005467 RepID=A0A2R5G430_NOSCO|nr:patatin-like phospholipase family protein [Nostoc commune]GBG22811.1 patatin [Nostoc commune NIES-4072]